MDNIAKARSRLQEHLSRSGESQESVAKKTGLSTSRISQFIKGIYTGDNETTAFIINSFVDLQEMRRDYSKAPEFTDKIKNSQRIMQTLDYVFANKCTGVVSGVSGSGKTTTLKYYQTIMSGVIYIQADATKWSPCSVLKLILKSLGKEFKGSSSDMLDKIVDELYGTERLIIIDEAQHMKARAFDTLRTLNDRAEVGVIYAGTPDIIERMTIGKGQEEYDQVYSRIELQCNLANRFSLAEISDLFSAYNLEKDVLKRLCVAATEKGGLRYAINLFKVANAAERGNLSVTAIEEAAKRVGKGA